MLVFDIDCADDLVSTRIKNRHDNFRLRRTKCRQVTRIGSYITDVNEALRELAAAARWVDRSALEKRKVLGRPHQALLKALENAGRFV